VNIVDVNDSSSPITIGGGSVANANLNPADLQIQYAGTGSIKIHGGSTAAVLYVPNAAVDLDGANSDWYGSLTTSTLTLNGNGASIHYDRNLANTLVTLGNWTMDTFTWSKYYRSAIDGTSTFENPYGLATGCSTRSPGRIDNDAR
jgi:hypothetical protein